MKRFVFAYEKALAWRLQQAQASRAALDALLKARKRIEEAREALRIEAVNAVSGHAANATSTADDLAHEHVYLRRLALLDSKLAREEQEVGAAIQKRHAVWQSEERSARLLSLLQDKQLSGWKRDYERDAEYAAAESWLAGRSNDNADLL